jgi:hypothetical protein
MKRILPTPVQQQAVSRQRGHAAFEVMLLLPTILLILVLLINMGYNGVRHRKAQAGLRLGAFSYIDGLARTDKNKARQQAQAKVNQDQFPGEQKALTLSTSEQKNAPTDPALPPNDGILGSASYRVSVGASVTRDPPYGMFDPSPIKGHLILAANTFTFCEMKDDDFDSAAMNALDALAIVGDYGLWLFGGCGGKAWGFKCEDKCT